MKKENHNFSKKVKYYFDCWMEKGAIAQFVLLLICFLCIVLLAGVIAWLVGGSSIASGMWQTLVHLLDAGTISGDKDVGRSYLSVMLIVTVLGVSVTGVIISIINNALEVKLDSLRRGNSRIMEEDHTVIFGCNENIYCILEELLEANKNQKRKCIVIIDGNTDKQDMERMIAAHLKRFLSMYKKGDKHTKIICRQLKETQEASFDMVSLAHAYSIIVNHDNDFDVLRILLAVTRYLENHGRSDTVITALLREDRSIQSARYATKNFPSAKILYFEDMLARIVAQVCRQPGLSRVLTEIFSYVGNEIYIEKKFKEYGITGKGTFGEFISRTNESVLIGFMRDGEVFINPSYGEPVFPEDYTIRLTMDDDNKTEQLVRLVDHERIKKLVEKPAKSDRMPSYFLILDWNRSLPTILQELDNFLAPHSAALIVSDRPYHRANDEGLKNITVGFVKASNLYTYKTLEELLKMNFENPMFPDELYHQMKKHGFTNVLLLSEDGIDKDKADAQTSILLLHLRGILDNHKEICKNHPLIITSEMNTAEDQNLLKVANINDFVVGSDIANRIMAQISNEPRLEEIYEQLLTAEGSEIYLRHAVNYIKEGSTLNFAEISEIVSNYKKVLGNDKGGKGENAVVIGYMEAERQDGSSLNRIKSESFTVKQDDMLVILAEGRQLS